DLIPDFKEEDLKSFTIPKLLLNGDETCEEFFTGLLHKKLNTEIIKLNGLKPSEIVGNIARDKIVDAVLSVKEIMLRVIGTNGFDQAQVTAGGVPTEELTDDLESKLVKDLYIVGELVNIDGICGGYNLQWAFTGGAIAGEASAKEEET
ncbi:MAG: NAD(P)/FAD-dependent oxidoreductase, partial [Lachnospiraceae bacterium]|nr:NAD(P)/FAD-dependent oxidoreductase [Lachnospiraceae bacterium]